MNRHSIWHKQETWKFIVQVSFSSLVLGFCMFKLIAPDSSKADQPLYWGGITALLAWWMPAPGASQRESDNDLPDSSREVAVKPSIQVAKTAQPRAGTPTVG
jgi:hypothetical protein